MSRRLASALFVLVSLGAAIPMHGTAATDRVANFPVAGVVVPGSSIGGVTLGMTQAQVEQLWGQNFSACTGCGPNLAWLYEYPGGDAVLGAAVKFSTPTTASVSKSAAAAAAAKTASLDASTAAQKATAAQTKTVAATATAKTDAVKATAAKTLAAKARAAGTASAARLEAAAKLAAARASAAKILAATDAANARSAESAAREAATAAANAETEAAAAAAAAKLVTVIAVFTLGSPVGWGLQGLKMGDPVSNVYNLYSNPGDVNCIGYSALTVGSTSATTSFYTANGVIYGFALTARSQSPCE